MLGQTREVTLTRHGIHSNKPPHSLIRIFLRHAWSRKGREKQSRKVGHGDRGKRTGIMRAQEHDLRVPRHGGGTLAFIISLNASQGRACEVCLKSAPVHLSFFKMVRSSKTY